MSLKVRGKQMLPGAALLEGGGALRRGVLVGGPWVAGGLSLEGIVGP